MEKYAILIMCETNGFLSLIFTLQSKDKDWAITHKHYSNANILEVNPHKKEMNSAKMDKELRKLRERILMYINRMCKAMSTII